MRISAIKSINFTNNSKPAENKKSEGKTVSNTTKLASGVVASAILGTAVYYIFRPKAKPAQTSQISSAEQKLNKALSEFKSDIAELSDKVIEHLSDGGLKVVYKDKKNADTWEALHFNKDGDLLQRIESYYDKQDDGTVFKIYKGDSILGKTSEIPDTMLAKKVFVSRSTFLYGNRAFSRDIFINNPDGTSKRIIINYKNGKVYERTVADSKAKVLEKEVRYNYAYENGKLAAIAKRDLFKDGNGHGVYTPGRFDPFPTYVKYAGDADYKIAENVYSPENLYEFDKKFNPDNL